MNAYLSIKWHYSFKNLYSSFSHICPKFLRTQHDSAAVCALHIPWIKVCQSDSRRWNKPQAKKYI